MSNRTTALIVEDEYLIALEIQRVLRAASPTATILARSVTEGIAQASARPLDLALISIEPNDPAGLEFCRTLHRAGVGVVAVSSAGEHRDGIPGLDGIGVVLKPFTDTDLLAAATAALKSTARAVRTPS